MNAQSIYPISRNLSGKCYDTDHAEFVAVHHKFSLCSDRPKYESYLWRTAEGFYFETVFCYEYQDKCLTPLRQLEAYRWLLEAGEAELAKTLFPNLPVLLPASDGHPDLPLSIRARHLRDDDEGFFTALQVWWWTSAHWTNLKSIYVASQRRFFLAEFNLDGEGLRVTALNDIDAKRWLLHAGVPELANYYFPSVESVKDTVPRYP